MDNNNLVNDLSGILDGLDSSQEQLEKDAFDDINSARYMKASYIKLSGLYIASSCFPSLLRISVYICLSSPSYLFLL